MGSGLLVVMLRLAAAGLIVMLKACVAVCAGDSESVALMVNEKGPLAVGVPEITPAVERDSPVGNIPLATVQLYGVRPPVAASV